MLRHVREDNAVPVIVLSGMADEADRIVGLELGADDYVVKPFSPRELVARVRSVLRRSRGTQAAGRLAFGNLELDLTTREAWVHGEIVELRRREFDLLAFLCRVTASGVHPRPAPVVRLGGRARVAGRGHGERTRAPPPRQVEEDPAHPTRIVTVRGVGYRFEP